MLARKRLFYVLIYGVELEHICAINTSPGPGYEWMFREDHSNGKSDDESVHESPIPQITWVDCRDEDGTGARTAPNGDWSSEAADWNEEVVTQELKGKMQQGKENEWVLRGHELISPPLTAPNSLKFKTFSTSPGMLEIASYLNVVKGTPSDPWGAMVNESCGLHVHVARSRPKGEKDSEMIPLPVLQHVALIIVRYKDLMTCLHPVSRRNNVMLGSNLMGVRRCPHSCQRLGGINLDTAQKKIFAKNMTPKRLAYLMDTAYNNWPGRRSNDLRYKNVNFQRLSMNVAKTIEFRQYEGTLDIDHIAHWVHFIVSVVRAAERMATTDDPVLSLQTPTTAASQGQPKVTFPRQQGDKYKTRCAKVTDELENLYDLLDFEEETRIWWRKRFCELNPDGVTSVTEEQCPACRQEAQEKEVNSRYEPGEWR
ncbi:hypothetical protein EDD37DRAFT_608417 [Exophiala viscosa]|uniref:uncharacterized protein n=1 Tax=Exophiala viscosa TaxID=2486360 RepID=UPI0021A1E9F1|nr:hypothetical protein EDD37DRAFT_608417 [Exophiala viscosa]